jgi:PTS system nitrogen regulatory IIA component
MGVFGDLSPEAMFGVVAKNKKSLLELLAEQAAPHVGRPKEEILAALEAREKLGSTALGRGVALPHAQLRGGIAPFILFARLEHPVDFEARDEEPVDLVFLILWPAEDAKGHIKAISEICRPLRDAEHLRQLRVATTREGVVDALRSEPF